MVADVVANGMHGDRRAPNPQRGGGHRMFECGMGRLVENPMAKMAHVHEGLARDATPHASAELVTSLVAHGKTANIVSTS